MRLHRSLAWSLAFCGSAAVAGDPLPTSVPRPIGAQPMPVSAPAEKVYTAPAHPAYATPSFTPNFAPVNAAPLTAASPSPVYVDAAPSYEPATVGTEWASDAAGLSWFRAEYLMWSLTGGNVPPIITSSPAGTPRSQSGIPSLGAKVLFGGGELLDDWRSGVRLSAGTWLESGRRFGVEVGGFWIAGDTAEATAAGDGSTIVASSPFINAITGAPSAILISYPGLDAGATSTTYEAKSFIMGEALGRGLLTAGDSWRVDGLVGVRGYRYREDLNIRKTLIPLTGFPEGSSIQCDDRIEVENHFCGGVLGVDCQTDYCGWAFSVRPSVALGIMENKVSRDGSSTVVQPGLPTAVYPGGKYVLISNIGTYSEREFTAIPSVDLRVSKQLWNHLRVSVGYSGTYFPSLVRAGEQIDPRLNTNLIPPVVPVGPALPAPIIEKKSATLHGANVGIELRF